jgi:hypothetical protein
MCTLPAKRQAGQLACDPSFASNRPASKCIVKLQLAYFERASQLLADLSQRALSHDPNHYLFSFSDEELFDLLVKPDEWSSFDVALAGQPVRPRSRDVSADTLCLLRQHRVAELAQPNKDHKTWNLDTRWLLGDVVGWVVWAAHWHFHRKLLSAGRLVCVYSARDWVHEWRILVLAIIMLLLAVSMRVAHRLENS